MHHQLVIAKFCHRMEQLIYSSPLNAVTSPTGAERQALVQLLERDLDDLEAQVNQQRPSCKYSGILFEVPSHLAHTNSVQ